MINRRCFQTDSCTAFGLKNILTLIDLWFIIGFNLKKIKTSKQLN